MLPKEFEELTGRPMDAPEVEARILRSHCRCHRCHTEQKDKGMTCSLVRREGNDEAQPGTEQQSPKE